MDIKREKRSPYDNCTKKKYRDLEKFFTGIELTFNHDTDEPEQLVNGLAIKSRVWLLFASNNQVDWDCVQVAHSKDNVLAEIKYVLEHYKKGIDASWNIEYKNSAFFEKVCPYINNVKSREALYRKIGSEYSDFMIRFLDVDKYLGIKTNNKNINDAERIIEICKNQYAEAKIAYQTLAVYWRLVSSAIDGQTMVYIVNHKDEF